jgi:hypothetical protein
MKVNIKGDIIMEDNTLTKEIERLVKEIQRDERDVITWRNLDDAKANSIEKAIERKIKLLDILNRR